MSWIFPISICEYRIIPFTPKGYIKNPNLVWCWKICWKYNTFVSYFLNVFRFIEDGSVVLNIFSLRPLSLCDMMACILLYIPVLCIIETDSMTWSTVIGYFFQCLESIHWLYLLQVVICSMGYCLVHGKYRKYCDAHSNG